MEALQTNIYVTSICTRNCPSCYYPRNGEMSLEMAKEIGLWIRQLCDNEGVKLFKAHFLGGEPLLNLDTLVLLFSLLDELPSHSDGKFVVFTNGDLLNEDIFAILKKWHVRILLNPTDHSIEWVDQKMSEIKRYMGGCSLAVVADEFNLPRLSDLAVLAVKHSGHIRVNRLYDGGRIPGYVNRFGQAMHRVFDVLLAAQYPMWPNFILESTYPLWEGPKNCHACGKWILIFDPDGSIRSCNGDMDTKIGHIHTHTRMSDFHFTHRWSSKNLEECKDCEWANGGWCQGGCPLSRKLTYGNYNHPTPFCKVYKTLFPRLKELKEKWIQYNARESLCSTL